MNLVAKLALSLVQWRPMALDRLAEEGHSDRLNNYSWHSLAKQKHQQVGLSEWHKVFYYKHF